MQIEEGFRDMKSTKFGLGYDNKKRQDMNPAFRILRINSSYLKH